MATITIPDTIRIDQANSQHSKAMIVYGRLLSSPRTRYTVASRRADHMSALSYQSSRSRMNSSVSSSLTGSPATLVT